MAPVQSYHFDIGDTANGPIGFCARINATSREEALEILLDELPQEVDVRDGLDGEAIGYMRVYLNKDAITVDDIDEVNDLDEDGLVID